jgi:class 3 adenylate cyclase
MLPPHAPSAEVARDWPAGGGDERYLVIMLVDMRGSTRLAERCHLIRSS